VRILRHTWSLCGRHAPECWSRGCTEGADVTGKSLRSPLHPRAACYGNYRLCGVGEARKRKVKLFGFRRSEVVRLGGQRHRHQSQEDSLLKRDHTMQHALRVLEAAVRLAVRAAETSTSSSTTGRLVKELENYTRRLKRLKEQGNAVRFFKVLRNAQNKLAKLVCSLLR